MHRYKHRAPYLFAATALILFGTVYSSLAQTASDVNHPGRVVDFSNNHNISVTIKAWTNSKPTGKEGKCSIFGDPPIDSKTSDGTSGKFSLAIPKTKKTYTVTYCSSQYFPRYDRDLPNEPDGVAIMPMPVRLWPTAAEKKSPLFASAVRRRAIIALNDLAYLRSLDPEQFKLVISNLASQIASASNSRAKVLQSFADLVNSLAD
jgi:hypothetical protein